ncbi:MAG: phospho-N-acetylmuramoyl-pentapeptide-transferase [Candidatus Puniceispirillales bacterium]
MILYLINYFELGGTSLSIISYLTMRFGLALMTSLFFILFFGPFLIRQISKFQLEGQPIRLDGPETHLIAKKGTPTMGGVIILLSILISILLWGNYSSQILWPCIFIMISFGSIGFLDDYKKISSNTSDGLRGKYKILLEIGCTLFFIFWISNLNIENLQMLSLPFFKNHFIALGIFFIPFILIVIVGSANAVNLTDGLDGLAIVPVMIVALSFAIICYLAGNIIFAEYLYLDYIPGAGELTILCAALIGSALGFLWYNAPPAMVFMGDTGSLSLGATIAAIAIMIKHELVLAVIGGLFVVEALSVIIQVGYFKTTGKRFFKMAPLHHHFEKKGWPESQIVIRFWIITIILAIIGLASLKIR